MPKAFSYIRFSTPEQSAGDSFRRQTAAATAYAALHGLELDTKLTYQDLGKSAFQGANVDTGALGAFLEAVRSGLVEKGSYLLVESLDRISRQKARKAVRVLENICDEGITVCTLSDGQQYTAERLDDDPMAFLLSFLVFIRANEESQTKSRRILSAWSNKRKTTSSKALTSKIPNWLVLDHPELKPPNCFTVNKDRIRVVREIFKLTLQGIGQHKIAEQFNKDHVPVFGLGKYWHRSYIAKILNNSAVIGTLVPHLAQHQNGKKVRTALTAIPDYYPSIIKVENFERVASLLKTKSPKRGRHAHTELRNIFASLATCPECLGSMTLTNKGKGGRYLVCSRAKVGGNCTYHSVKYTKIEQAFLTDALKCIPKRFPNVGKGEINDLKVLIGKLDRELANLAEQASHRPSATLSQKLADTETTKLAFVEALNEAQARGSPIASKRLVDLRQQVQELPLDRERINQLLRELLNCVIVDYPGAKHPEAEVDRAINKLLNKPDSKPTPGSLRFNWRRGSETILKYE